MNRFSKLLRLWLTFGMALALMATAVAAPRLTFKFTAVNIPGSTQVYAYGVSESGVVVGEYFDSSGLPHGFILKGKTVTRVDDPKGLGTICQNISPNGLAIVGYYINSSGKNFGFLLKGKTFTDILGPKGATTSVAFGVNDSGEVVGFYEDSNSKKHGFSWKSGKYKTLNAPGSNGYTAATGINNSGTIVLYWDDTSGNFESSLYNGSIYKTINVPGTTNSFAQAINTNGDVVYWCADSKGVHGALSQRGKYSKFDDPLGVGETYGFGLNSHRQIVGSYSVAGVFHGYEAKY